MDKPTKVLQGNKAREAIMRGVKAIYDPVRATLGPAGGNALLYRTYNRGSRITNDGVTIAKVISPKDEFEALTAQAFREAAEKTNEKAGDGTTSTIVIAGKLIETAFKKLGESTSAIQTVNGTGGGVMKMKKEMQSAMAAVLEKIKERAKKVETLEELEKIASVSVESEELGKVVASMVWEVGVEGYVDVVEGYKGKIETEVIKGNRFPAKIAAKAFLTNPSRFEMVAEDAPIVVTNFSFDNVQQLRFCNAAMLETSKLVIFAPSFSENVLLELVKAWKQGFFIYPVATPSLRTEQYEDLATYVGAIFVNKDQAMKLERIEKKMLGFAEKVVVKDADAREDAAVIGGAGTKEREVKVGEEFMKTTSAIHDRIELLQKQIEETKVENHKKLLERRIASMSSAIGVIRVGASSQAESLYQKLKIEDAVYACKAALQEGYVKGGGLCLKEIADELPENLLTPALKAPYEQIQENAEEVLEIGEEIIDPAKVVRLEVEHAVSVAANLVTAKIIVPEERELNMSEGNLEIAKALMVGISLWGKKEGLIRENEMEATRDQLQKMEYAMDNDSG